MKTSVLLICLIHISTSFTRIIRTHSDPTIFLNEDTFDSPSQTAVYFTPVIHQLNDDGSESIQKYVEVKDLVVTQYDTTSSEEPVKSSDAKEVQHDDDSKGHRAEPDNTKEDVLEEELIEFQKPKENSISKSGPSVSDKSEKESQNVSNETKEKLKEKETNSAEVHDTTKPDEKSDYLDVKDFLSDKIFGQSEYWGSDEVLGDNSYDDEKDAYVKDVLFSRQYFTSSLGDELNSHESDKNYENESNERHHHFGFDFSDPKYYY